MGDDMTRRPTFLSLLLLIFAVAATAAPEASSNQPPVPMPRGFETVRLGMTLEELQAARPEVKRDKFSHHFPMGIETLHGDDYFTDVIYEFSGGRLSKVIFSRAGKPEEIAERCGGLVEGSTIKWGQPAERAIGVIHHHPATQADHEYPLLTWSRPDATIVINCITTVDRPNAPNFYTLAIIDAAIPRDKAWKADVRRDREATDAEFSRLFGDLLRREKTATTPLFQ